MSEIPCTCLFCVEGIGEHCVRRTVIHAPFEMCCSKCGQAIVPGAKAEHVAGLGMHHFPECSPSAKPLPKELEEAAPAPEFDMKAAIKAYCSAERWDALVAYCATVGITDTDRIEGIADRIEDWASDGESSF